ncbi:MAG TPA: AI-2E family transporter [Acidimicrobiales bacterium]|nr:AI-2E family transporter [Acidimicrobiales bacterium]
MADEAPGTWRQRFSGSADRRGIPLGTIVVSVAVVILFIDINVALVVGLWVLRKEVLYLVVAFFLALLLTPPTRFLRRRLKISHGVASTIVFLIGIIVFIWLVYLFTSPLVSAVTHFAHEIPSLIKNTKKGKGPLGKLVYKLHLQKYLSEGSATITKQITKVLKPATAFSVGASAVSTLVSIAIIAILTFFSLLETPRLWSGFLHMFSPETEMRLNRVVNESIRSVTGYMLGNALTSIIAGVIMGISLAILGVPFALLLGIFVALVDLLPLVGGLLAGVPVIVIAAIHSVPAGIVMLVIFLTYQQIENHILNPVIMSKTVRLSPFWVLIAVLVGATLGGRVGSGLGTFVGALIGIPVGGAIQVVIREIRRGPDAPPAAALDEAPADTPETAPGTPGGPAIG